MSKYRFEPAVLDKPVTAREVTICQADLRHHLGVVSQMTPQFNATVEGLETMLGVLAYSFDQIKEASAYLLAAAQQTAATNAANALAIALAQSSIHRPPTWTWIRGTDGVFRQTDPSPAVAAMDFFDGPEKTYTSADRNVIRPEPSDAQLADAAWRAAVEDELGELGVPLSHDQWGGALEAIISACEDAPATRS